MFNKETNTRIVNITDLILKNPGISPESRSR